MDSYRIKDRKLNVYKCQHLYHSLVHYSLRLEEGEEIASSTGEEVLITALLGSNEILPCIEQAILTMQVGEHANFKIEGKRFLEDSRRHPKIQEDS